jgi:hypothetical protein
MRASAADRLCLAVLVAAQQGADGLLQVLVGISHEHSEAGGTDSPESVARYVEEGHGQGHGEEDARRDRQEDGEPETRLIQHPEFGVRPAMAARLNARGERPHSNVARHAVDALPRHVAAADMHGYGML